ncbi:MAG: CDP-diacylglycerol--serine O-phosphatidyltransferase [Clostridium sp.]|nr:CDP-diacylglycerol--serine O-phosphatidyltransferase [Clostridium sp.]
MIKRIVSSIPNTITCCNLLCGCLAVIFSFHLNDEIASISGRQWVYIAIFASAVFDFCDGLAARALRAYSDIGKELDSLSDLVSFGLAPGLLIFNTMLAFGAHPCVAAIALLVPIFGALRLAKFNVDTEQSHTFKGLPIPANALFWIGVSAWIAEHGYPSTAAMIVMILAMAFCMVANFKMFSLKFKNLAFMPNIKRYAIILAAIAFFLLYGVSGFAWTIMLYLLLSLLSRRNGEDED